MKKLIAIFLLLALLGTLAACGGKKEAKETTTATEAPTSTDLYLPPDYFD